MPSETKPHWTQTPEGRKRMAEVGRNAPRGADKAKRDAEIFTAHRNGEDAPSIGKRYGVTRERIRQIIKSEAKRRAHRAKGDHRTIKPTTSKPAILRGPKHPHPSESNGTHPAPAPSRSVLDEQLPYIYGRIEVQLEVYANNLGCTFAELAARLSELLRDKASGSVVRSSHRVPRVR